MSLPAEVGWHVLWHTIHLATGRHAGCLVEQPCVQKRLLVLMQVAEPKELLRCMQQLLLQSRNTAGPQDRHMSLLRYLSLFTSNPAAQLKLPQKGQVCDFKLANAMHR